MAFPTIGSLLFFWVKWLPTREVEVSDAKLKCEIIRHPNAGREADEQFIYIPKRFVMTDPRENGIFANVPLIAKGSECHYTDYHYNHFWVIKDGCCLVYRDTFQPLSSSDENVAEEMRKEVNGQRIVEIHYAYTISDEYKELWKLFI
jgi:hypothetical protein